MHEEARAFVIGYPIAHSRSPLIHRFWLEQLRTMGSYDRLEVLPDALSEFVKQMRAKKWRGCNVTIPHKQAIMDLVDDVSPEARHIGAANTLWFDDDQLKATNTDAYGFAANMDDYAPRWKSAKTCLIIGAGGAARAVIYACRQVGIGSITIVNRTTTKAEKLSEDFDVQAADMTEALRDISPFELIINTTSAGMGDISPLPIDFKSAQSAAIAADIVYAPLNTQFLLSARAHGLHTVDGLGMLLHQAVPGFEKWFGRRPKVNLPLRRLILSDLGEPT
ncbi:MAG: shikimate dehydrogenase [Pseudomonadota bacterium]